MRRDYTAQAQSELLELVRQVEKEKWSDITDWIGDRFIGLRQLVGEINIDHYLTNMKEYHRLVIDKNNSTEKEINAIFDEVYAVDGCFVSRFAACETRIDNYVSLVDQLAQAIDPTCDSCRIDDLSAAFDAYDVQDKALGQIVTSENGLSEETLAAMNDGDRQSMLNHIIKNVVDSLPGLETDGAVELALGAGLVLYYSVKSSLEGGSNVDLSVETKYGIKEGKSRLKDITISGKAGSNGISVESSRDGEGKDTGKVSIGKKDKIDVGYDEDGISSVSVSSSGKTTKIGSDGLSSSASWEHKGATYTYKYGYKMESGELYAEESVKVATEHGHVVSTAGVKTSNSGSWRSIPAPAYEPSPSPVSLPSMKASEWGYVAVAGAVVLVVAGVVLAPATGGGSLALCVI